MGLSAIFPYTGLHYLFLNYLAWLRTLQNLWYVWHTLCLYDVITWNILMQSTGLEQKMWKSSVALWKLGHLKRYFTLEFYCISVSFRFLKMIFSRVEISQDLNRHTLPCHRFVYWNGKLVCIDNIINPKLDFQGLLKWSNLGFFFLLMSMEICGFLISYTHLLTIACSPYPQC